MINVVGALCVLEARLANCDHDPTNPHAHPYISTHPYLPFFSIYNLYPISLGQQKKRDIQSSKSEIRNSNTCFHAKLENSSNHHLDYTDMEVVEVEDDLFFADLSKQISLLIMDEDEDLLATCPADSLQPFSGAIHPPPQSAFFYEQALRIQSKGTGVFIPQSTQPRRKHRKGRSSSFAKYQKQSQDTKMVSQVPIKNSFKPGNG